MSFKKEIIQFKAAIAKIDNRLKLRSKTECENLNNSTYKEITKITAFLSVTALLIIGVILIYSYVKGDYMSYKSVPDGAVCNDGTRSYSQGSGTCSWHDGVNYYEYAKVQTGMHYFDGSTYYILISSIMICSFIISVINKAFEACLVLYTYKTIYLCLLFSYLIIQLAINIIIIPLWLLFVFLKNLYKL